jgi:hypothetical protein
MCVDLYVAGGGIGAGLTGSTLVAGRDSVRAELGAVTARQGLTLVHCSAQRKHFLGE